MFRGHILTLSPFLKFGSFATKADLSIVSLSQRVTAGREGEQSNLKDLQFSHSVASRRLWVSIKKKVFEELLAGSAAEKVQ